MGLIAGVYSCAHKDDLNVEHRPILSARVSQAKAFFEKTYSTEAKTRNSVHASVQTMLSGMEIEPDWEYSIFSENDYESYLEVPLISDSRLGFGPVNPVDESQIHLSDRRLVVRQIKETGDMYLYTSIWIPDDDTSLIAMPSLTMFDKGEFSGRIYIFHSDGLFYWGAAFEDGEPVASLTVVEADDVAPTTRAAGICTMVTEGVIVYTCLYNGGTYSDCIFREYMTLNQYISCDFIASFVDAGSGGGGAGGGREAGGGSGSTPPPPPTYTVTVTASPIEGGTVYGGGSYANWTSVTISAIPKSGFKFIRWTGSGTYSSDTFTITVTGNMSFTAMFESNGGNGDDPCSDLVNGKSNPVADMELAPPVSWNIAGATYGNTRKKTNGDAKFHNGIDLAGPVGTPVYAQFDGSIGQVVDEQPNRTNGNYPDDYSGDEDGAGNRIFVISTIGDYGTTVTNGYCHLRADDPIAINPITGSPWATGDIIYAGQLIGYIGVTGNSNPDNPHLHLTTKVNGENANPATYLSATVSTSTTTITTPCD